MAVGGHQKKINYLIKINYSWVPYSIVAARPSILFMIHSDRTENNVDGLKVR